MIVYMMKKLVVAYNELLPKIKTYHMSEGLPPRLLKEKNSSLKSSVVQKKWTSLCICREFLDFRR